MNNFITIELTDPNDTETSAARININHIMFYQPLDNNNKKILNNGSLSLIKLTNEIMLCSTITPEQIDQLIKESK